MHGDFSLKVYYFVIMYIKLVVHTSTWAVVVKMRYIDSFRGILRQGEVTSEIP